MLSHLSAIILLLRTGRGGEEGCTLQSRRSTPYKYICCVASDIHHRCDAIPSSSNAHIVVLQSSEWSLSQVTGMKPRILRVSSVSGSRFENSKDCNPFESLG